MSEQTALWTVAAAVPGKPLVAIARRYAVSIVGPLGVSAAHFLASLIFLRELSQADFGLFSFLLVVVPFLAISASGALLNAPLGAVMVQNASFDDPQYATLLKATLVVTALVGALTLTLLLASRAPLHVALLAAPYATLMALRWFGRGFAFAEDRKGGAVLSDVVYSVCLTIAVLGLLESHHLTVVSGAEALLVSAALGVIVLGRSYLVRQFWRPGSGALLAYRPVWMEMTRWSLFGVVLSEMTNNAHAYFVTFVSGPRAFAVLAVGSLVMRPVSLVLSALPDFERPRMSRALAAGDMALALRSINEFRTAGGAIWLATVVLAGVLLLWFPHILLKNGYDERQVVFVIAIWAVIMAARILRTPESILLQSANEFKPLAAASTKSSVASVAATALLLLTVGPLAALCGILTGELVMTQATLSLFRRWKGGHG